MRMTWSGVTPEQYAEVRSLCGRPLSDTHHCSLDADGTWHWEEVWEDHEAAEVFFAQSLLPAVTMARLRSGPQLSFSHEQVPQQRTPVEEPARV